MTMSEITSPAELRGDAEVLSAAAAILRKYGRHAFAGTMREQAQDLITRSRHPSRQKLRGGTQYTPPPAPEGTEAAPAELTATMDGYQAIRLAEAVKAVVPLDYEEDDSYSADAAKLRAVHALLYGRKPQ